MCDIIRLGQVEAVRKRISDATSSLLGDTIVLSDEQWREPSRLPGWSRAHVATHIAQNADAFARLVQSSADRVPSTMYPSDEQRRATLERGADRAGLELQIDLDTSAVALEEAFDSVLDWTVPVPVPLPIGPLPVAAITVARFHEIAIHHLDLDCGFTVERLEPVSVRWLLQWSAEVVGSRPGLPAVDVENTSGVLVSVGDVGWRRTVRGDDATLWLWLTGRSDGQALDGADDLMFPLLS